MADASVLNKLELSRVLGWSRSRLDATLERDSNFPVRTRGDSPEGWTFSVPIVMQYLAAGGGKIQRGRKPAPPQATEPSPPPPAPAQHEGEATAKQRRDHASAAMLEDKLRRERGELLDREEVRQTIASTLAVFSRNLDSLPDQVVKLLGLDETRTERVREMVNDLRRQLVDELQQLLG